MKYYSMEPIDNSVNLLYGYLKHIDRSICDLIHPELYNFMTTNFPNIRIVQKREFYENTGIELEFKTVFFVVYKPNGIYNKNGMQITLKNYTISDIEGFEKKFNHSIDIISSKYEKHMIREYDIQW